MIREYRSPKTPFNVELAVNPGKQKSDRIDLGFFMLKAYPKNETTFQTTDINEYAIYTDTFWCSRPKSTHTNPRRPKMISAVWKVRWLNLFHILPCWWMLLLVVPLAHADEPCDSLTVSEFEDLLPSDQTKA